MKIAIAGTGYVGLSNAMIFAQHHQVVAYDLQAEKIKLLNHVNASRPFATQKFLIF